MLHVKVQFDDEYGRGATREIAALEIVNDGSHHLRPKFGNYQVTAFDKYGEGIAQVLVLDHRRDNGVWQLIAMASNAVASNLTEQSPKIASIEVTP